MSKNRFAGLQAVKQIQETKQSEKSDIKAKVGGNNTISKPLPKQNKRTATAGKSKISENTKKSETVASTDKNNSYNFAPRPGRPKGKRSNDAFQQVTAYVRRDTYKKVLIKLLQREEKKEYSELVEELMQKWLEN